MPMGLLRFAFFLALAGATFAAGAQVAFVNSAQAAAAAQLAIAYVADQHGGGNSTTRTVTRPGAVVAGRLMIAQVAVRGTGFTISAPAGWALISSANTAGGTRPFTQAIFWKRMAAGEPANYTFTWDGVTRRNAAGIVSYDNVDPGGNPIDASAVQTANNSATITIPGITTLAANSWIVALAGSSRATSHSTPAGMTERYDQNSAGGINGATVSQSTQLIAAAGAVAAKTSTVSAGATSNIGHIVALRPAGALTIAVPAGTAAGHVMIATVAVRPSASAITVPAGWTLVRETVQGGGATLRMATYRRTATGAEPSHYSWTFSGTHTGAAGGIASFSGVDTLSASPVNVEGGNTTPSSDEHAADAIVTTVPNAMLLSSHAYLSSSTWTPPVGMSEAVDVASLTPPNANGAALSMNHVLQSAAASTGSKNAIAIGNDDVGIAHLLALRPAYTHYAVTYPSGAAFATCEPALVRITAHHPGHLESAPPAGTVLTLNTSTANGVWLSPLVTGTPANWSPSGANNGVATYTWSGTETVIEARLRRNTAGSLHLNLSDPNGRSEDAGEDPTLSFANSVLRITANGSSSASVNTQIAGKLNTEGSGIQTLFVQAVEDGGAGVCTTRFQNQTRAIEFAAVCNNPATCSALAGTELQVLDNASSPVNVAKNPNTVTQATATYTPVNLNFSNDANAMAPLAFRYGDAGQMTLFLRHALDAPPATSILGASNAFVVRPFGLFVDAGQGTSAKDHTSAVLAAAGDNFNLSVTAYRWAAGEDDGSGNPLANANITDNGSTPSFAATATVAVVAGSNLPGVADGALARGAPTPAGCNNAATLALSGGTASAADWCYSEAGNVRLRADVADYISAGVNVTGSSGLNDTDAANGHVGRFRPRHFAVSAATLATRHGAACAPASSFTYLDEPLRLTYTLAAQNAQNATTQNYSGSYAKLGLTTFANWSLGARSGTTDLSARLDTGTAPTGSWVNGVASGIVLTTAVNRATPDNPDGPFSATAFGIAPVDADGVAMNTLDLDVDNNAVMDRKNLGVSGEFRFGRLRLLNAAGSLTTVLPVPFRTEFWNGSAFALNTQDSCTTVARNTVAMSFTPPSNLVACETAFTAASATMASGLATLYLAAPGAGNTGSVLLTPQLNPAAAGTFCATVGGASAAATTANQAYLTGSWSGAAYDDNPQGRASFGIYGSQPNNYIYFRENF